ncbi:unnamed protein product, partial [Brenthis ino]
MPRTPLRVVNLLLHVLVLVFFSMNPHCTRKVIGGELQERLIPVPYSKTSTDQAIRVVNAFRQGLDSRGSLADAALAEALRKQTALSKRYSHSSSVDYADASRDALAPHDLDVERLSSHSHTETAV